MLDWHRWHILLAGGDGICVSELDLKLDEMLTGEIRVPLAGGQYSFVSEYAPPRFSNFLSYITGNPYINAVT